MTTRLGLAVYDLPALELLQLARAAETCGFDTLWLGDHAVVPHEVLSVHPTANGGIPNPLQRQVLSADTVLHDPWAVLGAVAAVTSRMCVATGVLVLPLHHPLLVARAVATLQSLSAGRFLLGLGTGWVAEEFDALGVQFAGRGGRMDASLATLRAALAGGPSGEPAVQVCADPVPVPLVLGGSSPPALRRAARVGDGWLSSGAADVEEVLRSRDVIAARRTAIGRGHLPFRCFGRLPSASPALLERYQAEGVEDVVVWADHLWARSPKLSWERKAELFQARAAELGLAPARAA